MDYSHQPVAAMLRGPLISTPQGLVVCASFFGYGLLAVAYLVFGVTPPLGKSTGAATALCLFWPFIVFLLFVKHGLPSFQPKWSEAGFLALCTAAPVLYVLWWPSAF